MADPRNRREAPDVLAGIRRQVEALIGRCEEGDDAALECLAELSAAMPDYFRRGGQALHATGDYSWAGIGQMVGTSPQGAQQRFGVKWRDRSPEDRAAARAVAQVVARRVAAGLCRHCGGPVPCWSPYGDRAPGVAHPLRVRPYRPR
jgi:hypothetical protein